VAELLFLGVLSGVQIKEVHMAKDRQEQTSREIKHIRNDTDGKLPPPQPDAGHANVIKKSDNEQPKRDPK
jgi:CRISPR/Cas system-associated exonuclease Cas4 (RecB family)